jgi:voltage-gated potassium channel
VGQLEDWLEVPVLVLSVAWTALLILELIQGLSTLLQSISVAIWLVFGLEFAVRIQQLPPWVCNLRPIRRLPLVPR